MVVVREKLHAKYIDFILEPDDDINAAAGDQQDDKKDKITSALSRVKVLRLQKKLLEKSDRRHRFLAMDITTEGTSEVARRLCLFLQAHEERYYKLHPGSEGGGKIRNCSAFSSRRRHSNAPGGGSARGVHASKYASASCELEVVQQVLTAPMLPAMSPPGEFYASSASDFTTEDQSPRGKSGSLNLEAISNVMSSMSKGDKRDWKQHVEGSCQEIEGLFTLYSQLPHNEQQHDKQKLTDLGRDGAGDRVLALSTSSTAARRSLIEELFSRFGST